MSFRTRTNSRVVDADVLLEDFLGKGLLCARAECLGTFGRVDAVEPNLVLVLLGVENGQRVPVGNAHHQAGQSFGRRIGSADGCWIGRGGACDGGWFRGSGRGLLDTAGAGYRECGGETE